MQSFLIMTKDDNGYQALQFQAENELQLSQFNLLKQRVRNTEIELNRLLTADEVKGILQYIESQNQL
nr:MAG TPA: Pulmonary surfactant-associated protein D surfactant protein, trimer, ambiguous [Caudoviricetes sp.]